MCKHASIFDRKSFGPRRTVKACTSVQLMHTKERMPTLLYKTRHFDAKKSTNPRVDIGLMYTHAYRQYVTANRQLGHAENTATL